MERRVISSRNVTGTGADAKRFPKKPVPVKFTDAMIASSVRPLGAAV